MFSPLYIVICIFIFLDNICEYLDGIEVSQNEATEKINVLEREMSLLKSSK